MTTGAEGNRIENVIRALVAFPLLIADYSSEVLNLNQVFADKDDLRNFSDSGNPGVANQLGIEGR